MADDTWMWVIGGVAAAGAAMAGYLNLRINSAHEKARDVELATEKLGRHVSENYTTKAETQSIQAQQQHNLDRIHSRIDDVITMIRDMPQTILTMMGRQTK